MADQERGARRPQGAGGNPGAGRKAGNGRGAAAGRSTGAARPKPDSDSRPPRDGDARSNRDGAARPAREGGWQKRDGDARPKRDGDSRPKRDGDSRPKRDGDSRPPRPPREGSWQQRGADSRPKRDGGPRPPRDESRTQREVRAVTSYAGQHQDPELPAEIQPGDLEFGARAQLKTLSKENAERVAKHLAAAALFIDSDPELAHRHALAAARTAGRIAVVRESVAITAYETGDYALALRELRTYRRISGRNDHIALIVDSERGMGRPDRALEEGRAADRASLPVESRVALAIAMSGARLDLAQPELALAELEIPELNPDTAFSYSPMLFHAYAEVLGDLGRAEEAAAWRRRAQIAQEVLAGDGDDEFIEVIEELLEPDEFAEEASVARGVDADSVSSELPTSAGPASAIESEPAIANEPEAQQ